MTAEQDPRDPPFRPRVLVVDDAKEITDLIAAWLQDDYEVVAAHSGRRAYEVATRLTPSVMLIDVGLPDLNGFQLAEAVRQHPRMAVTPIIFISGLRHPENAIRALELGAIDFLHKPLEESTVRDRLQSALDRRP